MNSKDTISDQSFRPFIVIDLELLTLPLTTDAFRIYVELKRYANREGGCFPSYKTLGKCFKGSYPNSKDCLLRQKAIAAVKELMEWGLVKKEERRKDDESLTSNEYILTPYTEWKNVREGVVVGDDHPQSWGTTTLVVGDDPNKIQLTRSNFEQDPVNYLPPTPQGEVKERNEFPRVEVEIASEEAGIVFSSSCKAETKANPERESLSLGLNIPANENENQFQLLTGRNPKTGKEYLPWQVMLVDEEGRRDIGLNPDLVEYVAGSLAKKYSRYKALPLRELRREAIKYVNRAEYSPERLTEISVYWDDFTDELRQKIFAGSDKSVGDMTAEDIKRIVTMNNLRSLLEESQQKIASGKEWWQ